MKKELLQILSALGAVREACLLPAFLFFRDEALAHLLQPLSIFAMEVVFL